MLGLENNRRMHFFQRHHVAARVSREDVNTGGTLGIVRKRPKRGSNAQI